MRIAIIGGGVAGMATAWFLQHDHEVTLFDAASALGGHVLTQDVVIGTHRVHAETGPRFFFDASYPHFMALLRLLRLRLSWCDAKVALFNRARGETLVLPPRSLRQACALLRSASTLRHLQHLRRLAVASPEVSEGRDWSLTLREYLPRNGYPASFGPELLYPFLAACWGASLAEIQEFPAYSLLKGTPHSRGKRPGTYEIEGGMSAYMRAFGSELTRVDLRLGTRIRAVRHAGGFHVEDEHGRTHRFDQVVVATSSRDAVGLLSGLGPADDLVGVLRHFRHFETEIVVHGDASFMPPRREDWSLINVFDEGDHSWMTDWSGWRHGVDVFRTWMPPRRAPPEPLYCRRSFHHLVMTPDNVVLQRRIAGLQGRAGVWLAGMYVVDIDNHESALLSAVPLAQALAPRSSNLARLLGEVPSHANSGSPSRYVTLVGKSGCRT